MKNFRMNAVWSWLAVAAGLLRIRKVHIAAALPLLICVPDAIAADGGSFPAGELMSWLLSTLAVVVFIIVLAIAVKKTRIKFSSSGRLEILSQLSLGPKERVVELKAGERHLLLGVSAGGINLICELDGDAKALFKSELSRAAGPDGITDAPKAQSAAAGDALK